MRHSERNLLVDVPTKYASLIFKKIKINLFNHGIEHM